MMIPSRIWGVWLVVISLSLTIEFNVTYAASGNAVAPKLNPTGRILELDSPVQLNKQIIGSLVLTIDTDDTLTVASPDLLMLLTPRIDNAVIKAIEANAAADRISPRLLESAGITVSFDTSRLTLVLDVPEEMLLEQVVSLTPSSARRSDVVSPEMVSGFVNMRLRASHLQSEASSRVLWRSTADGKIRLGKPVLDFDAYLEEDSDGEMQWTRRGTRVFWDLPSMTSRVTLGDIFSVGQSFQSSLDVLGIRLGRNYQLVPGANIRPLGRQKFTLSESSLVSVIADGLTLRRLELEPGRYDLRDIPLSVGDNNIELLVESETGNTETLQFSSVYDSALLDIGQFDYSVGAGVLAERFAGAPDYLSDEPVVSAFFRTGVRPWLTAGINVQHAKQASLAGAQFLSASAIGPVRFDVATSVNSADQNGWAANLGYQSITFGRRYRFRTSFDVEYKSVFFDDVDGQAETLQQSDTLIFQSTAYTASTATTLQWSNKLTGTLGMSYSSVHSDRQAAHSLFGALSGRIPALPGWNWSTRLQWLRGGGKQSEVEAFVGLVYRPSRVDTLFSRFESKDNEIELGFRRRVNTNQVGGYFAEIDVNRNQLDEQRAKLNSGYTGNRFRLLADHTSTQADNIEQDTVASSSRSLTTVQFESSLAFAGSSLGFGRPIADSFALVDGHKTLEGRKIRVNPRKGRTSAHNSWLGAAVVPGLGRYSLKTLSYEVEDLPLGYDLGAGVFAVEPPEGAGYRLTVGSAATVTVIGVLVDAASNEPYSLVTGKVFNSDDPTQEPIVIFTNRTGKFAISGIAPGQYTLVLDGHDRSIELEVPEDGVTLMRLGEVAVN